MEPTRELIAERTIYAVDTDGRGSQVRLMIGKPYQTDSEQGAWRCPVAMTGLHGGFPDMYGADSWQALMLAKKCLKVLLGHFVEEGGQLFDVKDGIEISIEHLFDSGAEPVEMPEPDGEMNDEQLARVAKLTVEDIQNIDDALLADSSIQWRKVARIIGTAMSALLGTHSSISELFYAQRVKQLVQDGKLESQGNLDMMRFSEVRLPSSDIASSG